MARMQGNPTRVVIPIIDGMNAKTFHDDFGGIQLCGFLWGMIEHGIPLQAKDARLNHRRCCDPQPSPVMAGGLFSINRKWFLDTLGGYDTGISFWGTENLEMSFRIWMCGGTLEMMPCSRVYHVFRTMGGKPYHVPGNSGLVNKLRTIHGWLGNYSRFALSQLGAGALTSQHGDLSTVRAVQKRLQCKDFDWFMKNVYPDNVLIKELGDAPYHGQIQMTADSDKCLSMSRSLSAGPVPCVDASKAIYSAQEFFLSRKGELRLAHKLDDCVDFQPGTNRLRFLQCGHGNRVTWEYSRTDLLLKHSVTGKCMSSASGLPDAVCDKNNAQLHFHWVPIANAGARVKQRR
jgi:polypeptide N-acetylgalactosaminyltransferase